MSNDDLNLDRDISRALHRVVRAMHDGECPECHNLFSSGEMETPDGHQCPACAFKISRAESAAVLELFAEYMDRNLEVFKRWLAARRGS